jgi:hypothetical protein
MSPLVRRRIAWMSAVAMIVALLIIFPRVLAFAELAARELRYLWWLVLIAAIGIYLSFFAGRRKD